MVAARHRPCRPTWRRLRRRRRPAQLQAGEKIRVTVFGENSLSGEYQIDPSGFVSLPLAGTVKAAGLTQNDLARELEANLRSGYLKDPKVTISIIEFRPFYILGEVEKPGSYPYLSGLNVMSAIATAGGTTYRASQSTVLIQHASEGEMRAYDASKSISHSAWRHHPGAAPLFLKSFDPPIIGLAPGPWFSGRGTWSH